MTKGKLLYNRVCVGEHARFYMRDGWRDCGWGTTNREATVEGRISAVAGHRVSVHVGDGHVSVLRRVDIDGIEVRL